MRLIDVEQVYCAECEARKLCDSGDVFCDIKSMPTVDAVPVVRCKDCKYHGEPTVCPMCHEEYYWDEDDGGEYYTIDNTESEGFCHAGERRDTDEN